MLEGRLIRCEQCNTVITKNRSRRFCYPCSYSRMRIQKRESRKRIAEMEATGLRQPKHLSFPKKREAEVLMKECLDLWQLYINESREDEI